MSDEKYVVKTRSSSEYKITETKHFLSRSSWVISDTDGTMYEIICLVSEDYLIQSKVCKIDKKPNAEKGEINLEQFLKNKELLKEGIRKKKVIREKNIKKHNHFLGYMIIAGRDRNHIRLRELMNTSPIIGSRVGWLG